MTIAETDRQTYDENYTGPSPLLHRALSDRLQTEPAGGDEKLSPRARLAIAALGVVAIVATAAIAQHMIRQLEHYQIL